MVFRVFFAPLLDFIAPPRASERLVRTLSLRELRSIALRGDRAGSLPYHDPRVTALVWELKYYANVRAARIAGAVLADVLSGYAEDALGTPLLVPVPMHARRLHERGHNQTELLCKAALEHMGPLYIYEPRALVRVRHTPAQQSLHKHERLENMKGSMSVQWPERIRGRTCIVVDDVSTTGATFAEATRALTAAGAARVERVALAYS